MEIQLSLAALRRLLFAAVVALSLFGLGAEVAASANEWKDPYGLVAFLSLSYERNLPTWYSVVVIFSSGALLALIGFAKRREGARYSLHWSLLAATFLYISLDELAGLHEEMSNWFHFKGVLFYGWVIPAAILVLLWLAAFIPFIRDLPRQTRNRFVVAGAIYVTGALLVELPLGWWAERYGSYSLGYAVIDWVEETLEMAAMSLFLYRLVEYVVAPADRLWLGSNAKGRD